MTMRVRAGLMVMEALATLVMAGCDHYNCPSGATFGNSSCAASTAGLGSSTGSGSATAAFAFLTNGSGGQGAVEGYTLDTSATPATFQATVNYSAPVTPGQDAGLGMVVAQKQFLYTAFGSTGQIYGWSISSSGALTAVNGSPYTGTFATPGSLSFVTQRISTNPAGTLLFIADDVQDEIFVYQIGSGGVLTATGGFPVPFPPGNMTTDGLGKYLYITETFANHTGAEIAAYAIGSTGALTLVPGSPFSFPMWQVQGEPTGNFLIGTSGNSAAAGFSGTDDDHLYVFSITQSGATAGAITAVSGSPFATTGAPLSIAVQQNSGGNLVYSFGIEDSELAFNNPEGYSLSSSGVLTAITGSPFSDAAVGDVGAFDQSGDFVFIYGGVSDAGTVVFTLTAFDLVNGAPTLLSNAGTYGGFWAVTDAP